ncbi:hypothetical protein ACFL1X_10280, partial [Candidatus Hydrogenedentota bacterium]
QDAVDAGISRLRILLYPYGGGQWITLQEFVNNSWDPDNLPSNLESPQPDWTRINNGHIDSGQPTTENR